jgi:ribonuclease-3
MPTGAEVLDGRDDPDGRADSSSNALEERLGRRFRDPGLLSQALAHRSWCAEAGGAPSNERLEFLGDAVLGLIVADHCYKTYPELPEGALAKVRAGVVNTTGLCGVAREMGLGEFVLLGRGEDASGGRHKASILANTFEAVIGAVYLDGGWDEAARLVLALLGVRIAEAAAGPGADDFKTRLQELAVRVVAQLPRYEVEGSGPDHARRYVARVSIGGDIVARGEGKSKKDAEQAAARAAWEVLAASIAPRPDTIPPAPDAIPPAPDTIPPGTGGDA